MDHKPQVRSDHPILRLEIATLDALGELDLLCGCEQRVTRGLLEENLERLEVARRLFPLLRYGRLVQALDLAPLGLAAAGCAPESVLLLRITVRLYPFPFLFSISSSVRGSLTNTSTLLTLSELRRRRLCAFSHRSGSHLREVRSILR
jgi:hypothetical protein